MITDVDPPVIAPSVLSADFSDLQSELDRAVHAGADWIHADPMDGHFVPNLTIGPDIVNAIRRNTDLPLDVHLMLEEPGEYLDRFLDAGADIISFHLEPLYPAGLRRRDERGWQLVRGDQKGQEEALKNARILIEQIHDRDRKAGMTLNPPTPASLLEPLLPDLDLVLVMTVWPGFGGQSFMRGPLEKIDTIRTLREGDRPIIEVDGGVSPETIPIAAEAGAEVFVSGSSTFGTPDMEEAISTMRNHVNQVYSVQQENG